MIGRFTRKDFAGVLAILIFTFTFSSKIQSQTLRINEFMALNQTYLTDEDGEYSDWIEIYNPTAQAINLFGWSMTDEVTLPQKWFFPNITLNADDYLIVFASGKNRAIAGNELHTNFKLSGDGEYLALINPGGTAVTEFNPAYPLQQTDISYGYFENSYIGFDDPTPGASNDGSTSILLPAPVFSKSHGLYDASFTVVISSDVQNTDIYFTTDGSIPARENGTLYTAPINISTTTILRAVSLIENQSTSKITTASYIFPKDVIHQPNNPVGYPDKWGPYEAIPDTAIADYEMDPDMIADASFATKVEEALYDIPTVSLVSDKGNFFNRVIDEETGGIYIYTGAPGKEIGLGWERPGSVEYFNSDDSINFQVDCGIRLQGGHSRRPEKDPKHSFLLVFKSEYGPSRLNYPIFGKDFAQSFNNLILHAGFGLSWLHQSSTERVKGQLQRDIWTKDIQRAMGHHSSNSKYVHLYIDGIYWGVYLPSERMDAEYAVSYFGGKEEDYDVIKDYMESGIDNPAVDGTTEEWDNMIDMVNAGLSSNDAYQTIQGNNPDGTPAGDKKAMIDVVNFTDYMILNYYGSNTDWDHHNWAAMRNRVNPGKGFKFFCWDGEHMIKTVNGNVLSTDNDYCPSRIFHKLTENEEYKQLFASRVTKQCFNGGVLTPEKAAQYWAIRRAQVESSMDCEAARWGDYRRDVHQWQAGPYDLYTKDTYWMDEMNFMSDTYFPQRTSVFINQLRSAGLYPQVDAPVFLINDHTLSQNAISAGDLLSMTATQGTIYYTTDGNDPVAWQSAQGSTETLLISESADKKVLVPKSDIGTTWYTDISFSDASWQICSGAPGGIGYEKGTGYESLISMDVGADMYTGGTSPNTSCYIRIPFNVDANDLSSFTSLILGLRYDDGFVAYLNGTKVAEALAPGTLAWNSASSGGHEANSSETFDLSSYISNLNSGNNLLAIQGLNLNTTSSDFIISATLTASDQAASGSLSENAIAYSAQFPVNESSHIKARAFFNGEWSALSDNFFRIPGDFYDLKITEINYHPLAMDTIDGDKFEFIEIKNTGNSILDLGGLQFVNGIKYTFPAETEIKPNGFIVLASNSNYFYERYGFLPFDDYQGQLDNNGEKIELVSSFGDTISSFRFNDGSGWPDSPDGLGNTLVPTELNPTNDQNDAYFWRASYNINGSPGKDDLLTETITEKVISVDKDKILSQNYPNPFNSITYIDYQIPFDANVKISVFNVMGQQVTTLVNKYQTAGLYQVEWNVDGQSNISEGIYYYRLEILANDQSTGITKKMILVR